MTFAELKAELAARGFDYLPDARLGTYINAGRQQLDNRFLWPYREEAAFGSAPLAVPDLGSVEAVVSTTHKYPLQPMSYSALLETYGDLTTAGPPLYFYVGTVDGVSEIATYPTGGTIGVQYWKRTVDLSAGADVPQAPADYHSLIVDLAAVRAYMDADNWQAVQALTVWTDQRILEMAAALLGGQQVAGPADVQAMTGQSVDE